MVIQQRSWCSTSRVLSIARCTSSLRRLLCITARAFTASNATNFNAVGLPFPTPPTRVIFDVLRSTDVTCHHANPPPLTKSSSFICSSTHRLFYGMFGFTWANKLCGRPPQYARLQVDRWPFELESGVLVTCDVGYLCANFSLPIYRPLCSWLRPDVRDRRQTSSDVRQHHRLMPPPRMSGA